MKIKRLLSYLAAAVLLLPVVASCGRQGADPVSDTASDTSVSAPADTDTKAPDDKSDISNDPKKNKADATDIIFRQVYGTGKNNDTAVRYSFIELYNTADLPFNINGLAVYYYDTENKEYISKDLPDIEIPASSSYLIRCAEAKGEQGIEYEVEKERLSVKYYDLIWDIVIDNKEVQLALADKGRKLDDVKVFTIPDVYSYYIGTQSVTANKNSAFGITKNKAAFRAARDDKYTLIDYKNAPASVIMEHAPMCLAGDLNGLVSAGANVVTFSHEAGVYKNAFNLVLSAEDGYTIYYTTDGSDPVTNGIRYASPIKIADSDSMTWGNLTKLCNSLNGAANPAVQRQIGGRVIKAYAKDKNGNKTQVYTNTYFVSKTLSDYNTMLISMSVQPEDFLSEDKGLYYTQMKDPFGVKERRTTFTEIFETTGERVSAAYTEIALSGNGSLSFQAKSMRVYYKSDALPGYVGNPSKLDYDIFKGQARNGVTEYKRILLRNGGNDSSQTNLRDAYMQRLCSTLNVPTMASRPVLLFINGEMWGVYNARERYDTKYFESHFGIPEEDFCMLESASPLITGSYNTQYVLNDGEEGDEKPFHELMKYVENNDLSDDENFKYVADRIDIDNFIDFFVGSMYLANKDWPGNNIKVYRNKNEDSKKFDTKWRFVFSDMDFGVGLTTDINTNMFTHSLTDNTVAGKLMNRMLKNETFKNKFIERYYECADTCFDPSVAIPILNEMYEAIKDIMPLHFNRWPNDGGSVSNFEKQINNIRYFINNRKEKTLAHMEKFFGLEPRKIEKVNFTFDESAARLKVDGRSVTSGYSKQVKESEDVNLAVTVRNGYEFIGIKCTDMDGSVVSYNETSVTISIDSTRNIAILTKKTGVEYDPSVVTGSRAVLAVTSDGVLYAWGENDYGQLGMISNTITKPVPVFSGVVKTAMSMCGGNGDEPMTAVITADGALYTAGNNSSGQLGRSGSTNTFVRVNIGFKVKDIACGLDHLIVIAENGDMYGIGSNSNGQLGAENFNINVSKFQKIDENVRSAAAGRRHTIYLKEDGSLYALGDNRWEKFSPSASDMITEPFKVGSGFKFISSGQHNCLAINEAGDLYYFGWRSMKTFATGKSAGQLVKISSGIKEAYMQDEHIIMLGTNGKVYGYGLNDYKQINPDGKTKTTPLYIIGDCIACGAGTHYSAAIKSDGSLVLWGDNAHGVIGNGFISDAYVSQYTAIKLK